MNYFEYTNNLIDTVGMNEKEHFDKYFLCQLFDNDEVGIKIEPFEIIEISGNYITDSTDKVYYDQYLTLQDGNDLSIIHKRHAVIDDVIEAYGTIKNVECTLTKKGVEELYLNLDSCTKVDDDVYKYTDGQITVYLKREFNSIYRVYDMFPVRLSRKNGEKWEEIITPSDLEYQIE